MSTKADTVSPNVPCETGPSSGQDAITSGLGDGAVGASSVEQPASVSVSATLAINWDFTNLYLNSLLDRSLLDINARDLFGGSSLRRSRSLSNEYFGFRVARNFPISANLHAVHESPNDGDQGAGQEIRITQWEHYQIFLDPSETKPRR